MNRMKALSLLKSTLTPGEKVKACTIVDIKRERTKPNSPPLFSPSSFLPPFFWQAVLEGQH